MSLNNTLGGNKAAGSDLQSPVSWQTVRSGAVSLRRFGLSGSETLPVMPPHNNVPTRTSPRKLPKLGRLVRPIMTDSPNPGPNPEGFGPKPWGLLDFQDVAIFVWPDQREFEIQEQCLILQHRNAKLKDLTPEELIEIRGWISRSHTIDAEGQKVDLRAWRRGLKYKDLKKLVKRMEADLKWGRRIKEDLEREEERRSQKVSVKEKREKVVDPSPSRRRRKLVIEDSDEE